MHRLNLKMIHGLDNAASLYAVTVQGHHVAVLAKVSSTPLGRKLRGLT